MNKIIKGARFSIRASKEQRIRAALRGEKPPGEPDDVRDQKHYWEKLAQVLPENDPFDTKLAELLRSIVGPKRPRTIRLPKIK